MKFFKIIFQYIFFVIFITNSETSISQSHYNFGSIPKIFNFDSLEISIKNSKFHDINYINKLIIIEKNRNLIGSDIGGKYFYEIDSLSKKYKYLFGKKFSIYCKAKDELLNNIKKDNKKVIHLSEELLKISISTNDTIGVFYAELYLARAYVGLLPGLQKINENPPYKINLWNGNSINSHLKIAEYIAKKKGIEFELIYNLTKTSILFALAKNDNDLSIINQILENSLILISANEKYSYLRSYILSSKGIINTIKGNFDSSIYYYKKSNQNIQNKEASINYVVNQNIGISFFYLKKYDSSILYFKKTLNILKDTTTFKHKNIDILYNHFSSCYEKIKNYKLAYYYRLKATEILQHKNEELIQGSLKSQRDFEKIKEQEIRETKLLSAKSKSDQKYFYSLVFLIILICTISIILYSYYKLKNASIQINNLQKIRERFFTILSHDLRSPIVTFQGITSTLNFLIKQKKFDQIENISYRIDEITNQLKNLLQNLFEWSLFQQTKINFQPNHICLYNLLNDLLPLYNIIADSKNISININIDNKLFVFTDKNYLDTIIRNLIDNAIKYSIQESNIEISAIKAENNIKINIINKSNYNIVTIENIKELLLSKHVWQPGEKNIGLGLILVKEFSQLLKIHINLKSENNLLNFELIIPSTII